MSKIISLLRQKKKQLSYFLPRKFHVFCLGAAKTVRLVIDHLEGKFNRDQMTKLLKERDSELGLELESAHPLVYIGHSLCETFPQSKFIITIRNPYKWLGSRLSYHYQAKAKGWDIYRDYFWWKNNKFYNEEEILLKEMGLCSVNTYLKQYQDVYKLLESIPEDRCLFLKTNELNNSKFKIAEFLDINPTTLLTRHENNNNNKINIVEQLPEHFVKNKVMLYCQDIIHKYFPEMLNL